MFKEFSLPLFWFPLVKKIIENLNREIYHDIKNEKVAVIVENIQITEILSANFVYI